jgi:uncharacterized membrane protein
MTRFQTEQTIHRPAQDIWAYAADIVRHPDWMTVTDARVVRGNGTEVGARGRERYKFGPWTWDIEIEVAEAEPGRRIVWRGLGGAPFQMEFFLELEPVGASSTLATYGATIQMRGLWRLLTPVVAMEGKAGPARELQRLKERMEAAPFELSEVRP